MLVSDKDGSNAAAREYQIKVKNAETINLQKSS
jgi:hypothetical protein